MAAKSETKSTAPKSCPLCGGPADCEEHREAVIDHGAAPGERIAPLPVSSPQNIATIRVIRAEADHAQLIKDGAAEAVIWRAFIVALKAAREYAIAFGEDPTAIDYRIRDEERGLAALEGR